MVVAAVATEEVVVEVREIHQITIAALQKEAVLGTFLTQMPLLFVNFQAMVAEVETTLVESEYKLEVSRRSLLCTIFLRSSQHQSCIYLFIVQPQPDRFCQSDTCRL